MRRSALGARPILPHPLRLLPLAALLLLLAPHSRGAPQRFLWLSDVHLDHLYNQPGGYGACTTPSTARPMGAFGCDAPDALLDAALAAMRAAEPQPAFLLLTGDSSRHAPPSQAVMADLLRNVSQRLESVFTRVRRMHSPAIEPHLRAVLPVIGNNDVYPDYELPLQPNSTLLEDVAEAWAHELSAEEMAQVKYGGYFMRNMTDVLSVVALNTVVYSIYHTPAETPLPDDPLGQFAWLNDTLWQLGAAGRKVLVVGHIPPCVDSFGARPHLWHQDYLTALNGLLALHRETITALLFGHLHADEFRIPVLDGQVGLPLLLAGSLTPLYKNNPSFRVVTVDDDTGELLDYEVYYMDIANEVYEFMPLYRFSEAYGGARPQARDYLELACSFDGATPETSDVFARFLAYTSSNVTGSLVCWEEDRVFQGLG